MRKLIIANHVDSYRPDVFFFELTDELEKEMNAHIDYAVVENGYGIALVKVKGVAEVVDDFKFGHKKVLKLLTSADWSKQSEPNQ